MKFSSFSKPSFILPISFLPYVKFYFIDTYKNTVIVQLLRQSVHIS